MRYFIHLTHAKVAADRFAETYSTTLREGLFAGGRQLREADRSLAAGRLFETYRGQAVTVGEMYELDAGLDRGQLRVVCEAAADAGFGAWEPATQTMSWATERVDPQLTLGLLGPDRKT
jgi:hypothetical protein